MIMLVELHVVNFRSIRDETFKFDNLSVLIGKNNCGKSNLLDAIQLLIEGSSKDIDEKDFFDKSADISICGKFGGTKDYLQLLDDKNRLRLEECLDDNGYITIRRFGRAKEMKLDRQEILDKNTENFSTPTGIDAVLRQLLPEVVYVRPLSNVSEELSGKTTSAITKLFAAIMSNVETSLQPLLDQAFEKANRLLNVVADPQDATKEIDTRLSELKEIETTLNVYLSQSFPNTRARLNIEMPDVKKIVGNNEIQINDGAIWTPYYRQGQGLQRALLLSILQTLAVQIRKHPESKVRKPFMLLIEEPESFLHPVAQEQMRRAIETISASTQIIFATHSPLLVSPNCLPGLIRLFKVPYPTLKNEETRKIGSCVTQKEFVNMKDLLALLNLQRSSYLFFANAIILLEGEGDIYLHRALIEKTKNISLEVEDIALVEIGGKDRISRLKDLFRHFCPNVMAIADIDYLWTGSGNELSSDPTLSQLCKEIADKTKAELKNSGEVCDDEQSNKLRKQLKKKYCLCDELADKKNEVCDKLEAKGTFVLRNGEIEDYVSLDKSSKGNYLNAAQEVKSGTRPIQYEDELSVLYGKIIDRARSRGIS